MDQTTVSLVLGAGGARGYAHIGVINCLEERGFAIRSIAGASMGALVGGIYAAGKLETYTHWVKALQRRDVLQLLDLSFEGGGLFKGERIMQTLGALIGTYDIEDLPISFTAVATDLEAEREVWFSQGPLFDALRASIAIPTLFTPVQRNGRRLVDGGVINPLPIAPTLRDVTDLTLVVNLSGREEPGLAPPPAKNAPAGKNSYGQKIRAFIEELLVKNNITRGPSQAGVFDIVSQSLDTMQNSIARLKLASYSPDVVVEIPKNACRFYEFERAGDMIALGHQRAAAALEGWRARPRRHY
ncbi:MAG TPA: serine protease [Gammaproteobacteria bacterium]|nr:serine protease [Gammaproteobacteria bacterium]